MHVFNISLLDRINLDLRTDVLTKSAASVTRLNVVGWQRKTDTYKFGGRITFIRVNFRLKTKHTSIVHNGFFPVRTVDINGIVLFISL